MQPLQQIALVVNRLKPGACEIAQQLQKLADGCNVDCRITEEHPLPDGFLDGCDAVCVIGGDGTLLGVVPQALEYGVKVLGVNLGKLGFLVTFAPDVIMRKFTDILEGTYELEKRTLLRAESPDGTSYPCLNDVVIKQTNASRMMNLEVFADDILVNEYSCDGLIFSTPTGSTAYNLSAGGPIMHPELAGIALTPICPHTLSNRSVLFPDTVCLRIQTDTDACSPQITLDGHSVFTRRVAFPLRVTSTTRKLELVHGTDYSHFETIRAKLFWRETSI